MDQRKSETFQGDIDTEWKNVSTEEAQSAKDKAYLEKIYNLKTNIHELLSKLNKDYDTDRKWGPAFQDIAKDIVQKIIRDTTDGDGTEIEMVYLGEQLSIDSCWERNTSLAPIRIKKDLVKNEQYVKALQDYIEKMLIEWDTENHPDSYWRRSCQYLNLTYLGESKDIENCKIYIGWEPEQNSEYPNSFLVEILKTICARFNDGDSSLVTDGNTNLDPLDTDSNGFLENDYLYYYHYACRCMGQKEKLSYCLYVHYDEMLSSTAEYKQFFSKRFIELLFSELRDPDSKERKKFEEESYWRSKQATKRAHWRRNYEFLTKRRKPNDTGPKNLIFTYWNAVKILASNEKGRGKESGINQMRFTELGYLEWRTRVDTAWRLYFVLTKNLLIGYVIHNYGNKWELKNDIKDIITVIACIQDEKNRIILIDLFHKYLQSLAASSNIPLNSIKNGFICFAYFELEWEGVRRLLFTEKEQFELLDVVMNESYAVWIDQCKDMYGMDLATNYNKGCLHSLIKVMHEIDNNEDLNNGVVPDYEMDSLLHAEIEALEELLEKDSYEDDYGEPKVILFKKIWDICYDKVPKL